MNPPPASDVLVSQEGPVRVVRMNRPAKKNALTLAMYDAMAAALEDANTNDNVRCLLIAGSGGTFTAGNDISDFMQAAEGGALARPAHRFLLALARCEKPLTAAVAGNAVGVGTTLLFHCDHVIAAEDARLSTPFISLGILPEAASTLLAPRVMGQARAFSLLVMGKPLSASEAKEAGIVNRVLPAGELEAAAMAAAREIAALPPQSVLTARRLMRGKPEEPVARIEEEAALFAARLKSGEAKAAFAAFLARKK